MLPTEEGPVKKRKLHQRACDRCRTKKIKCDGPQKSDVSCSRCVARRVECTYKEGFYRSSYSDSYVESLESRLEKMEALMRKIYPDLDAATDPTGPTDEHTTIATPATDTSNSTMPRSRSRIDIASSAIAVTPRTPADYEDFEPSDREDSADEGVLDGMQKLAINSNPMRYHGKSSSHVFIKSVLEVKNEFDRNGKGKNVPHRIAKPFLRPPIKDEMPLFEDFPPDGLLNSLVDLYFRERNDLFPLLHEPSFKQGIKDSMHRQHGGFGAIALLVCALGARFSHDPRVLSEDADDYDDWSTAGWKWFLLVEKFRKSPLCAPRLYDLQIHALMVMYLHCTNGVYSTWQIVGNGIRMAIDVGAHRRTMYSATPTVEEELWRRAVWMLVVLEWMTSFGLGRPSAVHDEDVDLALPTEVDDEYWQTPDGKCLFQQPASKPSKVSFFVYWIRLTQILAFATRTIYSTNKSRAQLGNGDRQWEQRIVTELDSALNRWIDLLPPHLRWNPEQPNTLWLTQSATLFATHRHHQILVHRPFISPPRATRASSDINTTPADISPLSVTSRVICTNAARSLIPVMQLLTERTGKLNHFTMVPVFTAANVLMLHVFARKRSGKAAADADRDLALVEKCLEMIQTLTHAVHSSQPVCEILRELLAAAAPSPSPPAPPDARRLSESATASSQSAGNPAAIAGVAAANDSTGDIAQAFAFDFRFPHPSSLSQYLPHLQAAQPSPAQFGHASQHQQRFGEEADPLVTAFSSTFPFSHGAMLASPASGMNSHSQSPYTVSEQWAPTYGLEPLGYSEAVSHFPPLDVPQTGSDANPTQSGLDTTMALGGYCEDDASDLGTLDSNMLALLSNTSYGWGKWEQLYNGGGSGDG